MYTVTNSFKENMKKFGKQLNVLLKFGNTTLNKKYAKNTERLIDGDLFTSVMTGFTIEVEKYESLDPSKILTVKQINEITVEELNVTRTKYLTTPLDAYNVEDINNMTVQNLNNTKNKFLTAFYNKEDISKASTLNIELGVKVNNSLEYEYLDYGEYVIYNIEEKIDTNSYKLTLYDNLIKTHIEYDLNLSFPMTVLDLLQAICNRFEFNLMTTNFANANEIIDVDKYTGLNYTFRDILDEIAGTAGGFIKIRGNNLYVCYPTDTGEIIDENDLEKLTIGDKFGPYNCVVLGRSPQEDNIYYPTNMEDADRNPVRIDNNQIMDSHREDFIEAIYNKINGLYYYSFDYTSFGFGYFEFGDIVTLKDLAGNEYKTILMNLSTKTDTGIKETGNAKETAFSETKYENATGIEKRIRNTEIICNKQEGKIQAIIEEQSSTTSKVNTIEMDLESTELKIENVEADLNSQTESLRQDIEGLTNTLAKTGGSNVLLYAAENYEGNIEEYSDTEIINNSISGLGYKLKIGTAKQIVQLKNGIYTISFLYKKLIQLASCYVKINDIQYELTDMDFKEFEKTIEVTSNIIKIEFITDTNDSCYIADLMGNIGETKITWEQNANETITDTVQIGKGLKIKSSVKNTELKADADGVRINNTNTGETKTEFTDKGMETEEMICRGQAQMSGLLVQKVYSQIWLSSLL